jgi:UDP-N-acetylglucosamine 1-carboxyvinyltransferase
MMVSRAWRIRGGTRLHGDVSVSGSKNAVLPVLAASLLVSGETVLENVPGIADVASMVTLLRALGLDVDDKTRGVLLIRNEGLRSCRLPDQYMSALRASHYLLGPVALKMGEVESAFPGGCDLGHRAIDHLLAPLHSLGMRSDVGKDRIRLRCGGLRAGVIALDPRYRLASATYVSLIAASVTRGITTIHNASFEPDVFNVCQFLQSAGARIGGIGSTTLVVEGVADLQGTRHRMNSDRLEGGTLLCAGGATGGEILVRDLLLQDLGEGAEKLAETGAELTQTNNGVLLRSSGRPRAVDITTGPFPASPTDIQPPMAALLSISDGRSVIREAIYQSRLQYARELQRMGAKITIADSCCAVVDGVSRLTGATVEGGNIRDVAALVIAALTAEGDSTVSGLQYLARGHCELDSKLRALGADITDAQIGPREPKVIPLSPPG